MRIAFSSALCPDWNLLTMVEAAQRHSYSGIELAASAVPGGVRSLSASPDDARGHFVSAGVEVAGYAGSATLDARGHEEISRSLADIQNHMQQAAGLGCTSFRIYAADPRISDSGSLLRDRREIILARVCSAVRALVSHATQYGVTILVENAGEFADSVSMWHIVEAAGSPLVRACWNPAAARDALESSTTSIPRLGSKIASVRLSSADVLAASNAATAPAAAGSASDLPRMIQLLKGIAFRGYLIVDLPIDHRSPRAGSPAPTTNLEVVLPAAGGYLRKLLDEKPIPLTAYKGDKFRPRQGQEFAVGH